jgi:hypothetical protein
MMRKSYPKSVRTRINRAVDAVLEMQPVGEIETLLLRQELARQGFDPVSEELVAASTKRFANPWYGASFAFRRTLELVRDIRSTGIPKWAVPPRTARAVGFASEDVSVINIPPSDIDTGEAERLFHALPQNTEDRNVLFDVWVDLRKYGRDVDLCVGRTVLSHSPSEELRAFLDLVRALDSSMTLLEMDAELSCADDRVFSLSLRVPSIPKARN